ncbi:hypothetical protein [Psychrobacter sp. DAB_AL32B]|uniref:hypothetical protein n=1 Tax=Psychrobacter sp. DAB_AL32B TaxID=1028414 RepID=UPI000B7D1D53|nr:hypothetical protein [Psychrobacter sp. DAB_AL32B]OXL24659.1 hypothetical protein CAN34_05315 [Psychrobacter sp. DAB_AL32B]
MSQTKLFDDVTVRRVLDKLIPIDSPHYMQMHALVAHIISLVPDDEVDLVFSTTYENLKGFTDIDCEDVIKQIIRQGKTVEWAVSYMLIVFYQVYGEVDINNNAWRFMSGYLKVMVMITARHDKHFAKIDKLSVRVRMALRPTDPQRRILDQLISIHAQCDSLSSCLPYIRQYEANVKQEEATGETANQYLGSKIGQIRLAYEVAIDNKAFIGKTYTEDTKRVKSAQTVTKTVAHIDGESLQRILFSTKQSKKHSNVAIAENIADDDEVPLLDNDFKPAIQIAKSSELQQWRLKNNHQHARRNQFHFPTNHRQLSITGYQMLFATLWQRFISENTEDKIGYAVLLLSLLSGLNIDSIIADWQCSRSQRKYFIYDSTCKISRTAITIDVTTNTRNHLLAHRQSYGSTFYRALPVALQVMLEGKLTVSSDEIKSALSYAKSQLDLPALSPQHIEVGLLVIIKNELKQPLHADLITGVDVRHSSALYYTSTKTVELEQNYIKAVELITEYCNDEQKALLIDECSVPMNGHRSHIGSDMALKTTMCQQFFNQLAVSAESFNGKLKSRIDRYIAQFNSYSIWLWHIVMIQTGIRPVRHAPGLPHQFDLKRRILWVSDKEERHAQSDGRLIPLSKFLITAIQNYMTYIEQFAAIYNPLCPAAPYPINDILQSERPLIQLYKKNPKGFTSITPSQVRYQLQDFFSHQDNWLRHQLRSMLTGRVTDYLICALYGHEHPNQEFMHPMSSSFINQLHQLSPHLDAIATDLHLKQIEVRLYG